ncbi:DDE family endonuclease [Mycena sanguinolenta]|uniref:DDE family endonuclease n=1 Tax=Mycena sanguinolenta TaxID=230812 RepID=A0A8H6X7Q2_9AGAR|nr:DDE family endonuclease [Mycena sanguinolenta]
MARKQRAVPLRQHYSRDLKRRVIHMSQKLHLSSAEIVIMLDMPLRVVQRVRQVWNEIGEAVDMMLGMLDHSPDLYLDEIQEQIASVHGIEISLSTITRTLKRLGMTSKKLSRTAAERCEDSRREFVLEVGKYPPEYLVTADEAAVNILTTYRNNGWSYRGLRAPKKCNFVRGIRYSLLPAITIDGLIYTHVKVGGYNGEQFVEWLEGLLQVMNPYPAPHSVLILDNCRIHHVDDVQEMCDAKGVKLLYLPPYSPDFNPIEECFSWIKHYIRRNGQEFRRIAEGDDKAAPYVYLYDALSQVTAEASRGWFRHSGYF